MTSVALPGYGRTRWRRFGGLLVVGVLAATAMLWAVATGALAINLSISGMPFTLSASTLSGDHFVQYAQPDQVTNDNAGALIESREAALGLSGVTEGDAARHVAALDHTYVADTVTALTNARISDLRQTVCAPLPFGFNLLVRIAAGSDGTPASADHLLVNAPALGASSATFQGIKIGADAHSAVTDGGYDSVFGSALLGAGAGAGNFSQAASKVTISNVRQVGTATAADVFTLPGLGLGASFVDKCS